MGDTINHLLDNLIAVAWRLLDLPLLVLLPGLIIAVALIWWVQRWIFRRFKKRGLPAPWFIGIGVLAVGALIVDLKVSVLKHEVDVATQKYEKALAAGSSSKSDLIIREKLVDLTGFKAQFSNYDVIERTLDQASDLIILRKDEDPKAVVYLAVIDLTFPNLEIVITPEFTEKWLTSDFAKKYGCSIAINGEAGETMYQGSGLGEWTGNWIVKGKPVLQTDSDIRPFMSFNRQNRGTYSPAAEVDTALTEEKYNAIWGRFDLLVNGQYANPLNRERAYARTLMALDEGGTKLYLLIADGKRPDYSLGLSLSEGAAILASMGAWNGMMCDQGGSSCMYLEELDGIANRPADSDGYERVVYSHFGVKLN